MGVMLLTVFAIAPAAAGEGGGYIAGTGDLFVRCGVQGDEIEQETGACLGGQIFSVPADTGSAAIEIDDEITSDTAGFYQFEDADGNVLASGAVCGSANVAVPADAAWLGVFVDTTLATLDCGNPAALGTTGEIVVTWT